MVIPYCPAKLQQSRRRRVDLVATSGFALSLFGVDFFELAVVHGVDTDALVPNQQSVGPTFRNE
jgi:hypothetical protein